MTCYLDIDIKNNVYSNSKTPATVSSLASTPLTAGKRRETEKAHEVLTHQRYN
jgi:hypothetical protein